MEGKQLAFNGSSQESTDLRERYSLLQSLKAPPPIPYTLFSSLIYAFL